MKCVVVDIFLLTKLKLQQYSTWNFSSKKLNIVYVVESGLFVINSFENVFDVEYWLNVHFVFANFSFSSHML